MNSPSSAVAPGWWAFVAFFFLALGLWLLMRSMYTRLRRMRLAEQERQRAVAAEPEAQAQARHDGDERAERMAQRARKIDLPAADRDKRRG